MNPIFKNKIKGRVLIVDNEILYRYNLGKILYIKSGKSTSSMVISLPGNSFSEILSYINYLTARLLRNGVHHFIPLGNGDCAFIYNKRLRIIKSGEVLFDEPFPGSRPLSFEKIGNKLIFGEYR
ncbi:MAG: hypothetical protein ACOCQ4_00815, partial [bacterium]